MHILTSLSFYYVKKILGISSYLFICCVYRPFSLLQCFFFQVWLTFLIWPNNLSFFFHVPRILSNSPFSNISLFVHQVCTLKVAIKLYTQINLSCCGNNSSLFWKVFKKYLAWKKKKKIIAICVHARKYFLKKIVFLVNWVTFKMLQVHSALLHGFIT